MKSNLPHAKWRLRRALGVLALATSLPLAACSTDEILSVNDPDIIDPGALATAGGAEATRIGALSRFIGATSGYNTSGGSLGETLFTYGGLLADEWQTGDTFIQRVETDQRTVQVSNSGITNGLRYAFRARLSAEQAIRSLREFAPDGPSWHVAEMYFVQAYLENMLAEHFCSGLAFSTITQEGTVGTEAFGPQLTTVQTYERALAHADSALALATGTTTGAVRVRNAAAVIRGRILLNLGRFDAAAAAVQNVPDNFAYVNQHSQTTRDNINWFMNNNSRRYTVANNEGRNGLNFATANDPRLPVCLGGSPACKSAGVTQSKVFNSFSPTRLNVQLKWPTRDAPLAVATGIEARLIQAEAQLAANNTAGAFTTLNRLRSGAAGLGPLTPAATAAGRVDQLFRERAFWMFGTGHRLGDLRRLIRQYGRNQENVFPVGRFAEGGDYGDDVNLPVSQSEENNPQVTRGETCLDRKA